MENPKIRFKGFTKDWEQRKLIDVCDYVDYRGKTPTKTDSGVFLVTAKNVKDGYIDYGASQEYISEDDYEEVMHRGKPEIGDVLITTEAPCGNVAQVNRADIALAQRIIKYRGQSNIVDNTYLKYYLLSPEFQDILNAKSSGGTVKGIKGSILHQQEIKYPKYEEQFKIGSYFNNLDHLITLHQRKCEQTKKLKKYMLQKMFPRNGAKVPEIRFYGFTYDWEQRKLGDDLVSIHTGTNLLGSITNTGMPLIKMGNIQRGYFDTSKVEFLAENEQPDKADIVNYGDFFFNTRNTLELVGKGATWMKNSGEYAFNSNIARFELRNLDTIFFNYLYNTDYMTKQIHARAMGTTSVAAIYPRTLDSVEYLAPCMKEQQKIGAYFKQLDHLITLHQRKCDELKKMKKYMLQNMFI